MGAYLIELLDNIHNNLFFCFLVFAIVGVPIVKLLDKILARDRIKNRYFRNENNRVCLCILIAGVIQLLIGILIGIIRKASIPWYVLSACLIIAGILGLIPFSFFEKPPGWYKNRLKK